jgi:O-antigen ligase
VQAQPERLHSAAVFGRIGRRVSDRRPRLLVETIVAGAALLLGALASLQGSFPYLLASALAIVVSAFFIATNPFRVLAIWVAVEAVAYPFLRYPLHHDVATFDRFVILGLGASLFLVSWTPMTKVSRMAVWAFAIFTLIYGASMLSTLVHPLALAPGQRPSSSIQPEISWIQNLLLPLIVFVVAARTVSHERWRILARALACLGVSLAALASVNWILGINLSTYAGFAPFFDSGAAGVARATGPYASPSAFGSVMVVCIAATLYLIQVEKVYLWGGMAFAFELISLAPTLTKTVWSAGLVTIIIALGLRRRITSRLLLVGLTVVLILGIVYSLVGSSQILTERTTSVASTENFVGRLATWQQGLLIFQHWPLFGAGYRQFINAQAFVPHVYVNGVLAVPSAHNTEVAVLAETGLLGSLAFAVLVYAVIRLMSTWRRQAQTSEEVIFGAIVLAAVIGYVLLSQTFGEIYDPPSTIFVALILGAMAGRLNHNADIRRADPPPQSGP